jgi:hypothetical protein
MPGHGKSATPVVGPATGKPGSTVWPPDSI